MIYLSFIQFVILSLIIYTAAVAVERFKFKKRLIEWHFSERGFIAEKGNKILKSIDALLAQSGLKRRLPFLNAKNMAAISLVILALSIYFFHSLGFAALFYAFAVLYLPFAFMMFLSAVNAKKVKEAYLSFLTTFMGFYNIEGNIINALKSTAPYISNPLKSIIERNVFLFEKTQMNVLECLDNMASEAGNNEFRKFINFAKMSVKYGGNFNKAIAKLKDQGEKLYSLEAIKSANASVGSFVILLMIVINLLLMVNISSDPDIVDIIKSTVTGQVIAVSNAVSIIFGLYMIKNINSSV
ncbi:type II secretion system F family protein [Thermoanaerobacterium thermosaccharolyticum]|uniref:Tight adherence protein B n=1 Tax=Thermoanaerobacterium thermosaccharolyticum (strain ATCC 7956 / DSM 571 / NCIMB 9385 / NCA 3814 / NCTC 13789 / WDCM 00135 / 2032) TaxID=580327 RepID=D9TQ70_THETC|nr:hypothetical protein [Thermoanaerobacterium thermosaccharolyticum]ADL67857.1 hypothetical protein Tthe_0282 [Thermoanaerobacterium thermosaccharolyticum DSM 571]KAA5806896.1 hypothetical protein F1655_06560 [Thermoanaerobacterium thermosaccharolyticum]TCW42577.1 tight adherence protein B [Thermohydrogenium kirishiense]